jgi:bifunctional non-homologous end joining protein LigD
MSLKEYNAKRDFTQTAEPNDPADTNKGALKFVVQRHQASSLHYDFRLEMAGVLKSWAVPKGPSLNPRDKRLAMRVEDHPFSYRTFQGDIPAGNYGAGHMDIWDEGEYHAAGITDRKAGEQALLEGLEKGSIRFVLQGRHLKGEFSLVEMKGRQQNAWLLVKKDDDQAVHQDYDAEDLAAGASAGKPDAAPQEKPAKATGKAKTKKKQAAPEAMPHAIKPMMARLTDEAFDDEAWIFETKWDGYRAVAEIRDGTADLYSRSGKSFRAVYKPIVAELSRLGHEAVLDGEVVVLNDQGFASFQDLQNYQNTPHQNLYYYVFDLLYLDGEDLRSRPLLERKQKLESLLRGLTSVRYSTHVVGKGKDYFKQARKNRVEGIMAKLATSPYRTGQRSAEWLKIKTHLRQEVVIGGFTEPQGSRQHLGALLLGVYEGGQLRYIGQSGSGFNQESLSQLKGRLEPLAQPQSPFAGKVRLSRAVTWVRPELVCEISFAEWTSQGHVRQAIFEGLRPDKSAREVTREKMEHTPDVVAKAEAVPATPKAKSGSAAQKGEERQIGGQGVRLTSLDKPYWPEENITKGDLIHYYQQIAPVLLPYLRDRAESLLRHPNGIQAPGFFQKDIQDTVPDWITTATIHSESTDEDVRYIVCQDAATLAYMNNLGCIQLNPWNSRIQQLEQPDWAVIDLDPGENTYDEVVEVALVVKEVADAIGASCYPKTSGATGMHIYFPLGGRYPFATVKDFAHRFAQQVHRRRPKLTSLERLPKERRYQVYLDFLQNAIGQTIAAPYCVRPRPGATVSAPLRWEEVKKGLHPRQFTLHNMPARLQEQGDLFRGVLGKGLKLEEMIGALQQLK